ncbi:MAG: M23 family metallopeptidase [Caldilineales bacterium]
MPETERTGDEQDLLGEAGQASETSPDELPTGQDQQPNTPPDRTLLDRLSLAGEYVARLWQSFKHDNVTPVRIASHVALLVIAALVLVLSQVKLPAWEAPILAAAPPAEEVSTSEQVAPILVREAVGGSPLLESGALLRAPVPFTQIPDRPREGVITYTVQLEDTVLGIAEQFHLNPNTIIWANLEDLSQPFFMEVGQSLRIPPVDGVLHTVTDKDTLAGIAKEYKVDVEQIVGYAGNNLASADAPLTPGQVLVVPDGDRTPPQAPAVARAPSAPWRAANFVWPAYGRLTQGYYSYHPAIDIGAPQGTTVVAGDEGIVAVAGWSNVGYGNYVVIRHPDGYVTLYGHLSRIDVSQGDYVARGQQIGAVGSTGRSTGPHLHFEVSTGGRNYNPLQYLP